MVFFVFVFVKYSTVKVTSSSFNTFQIKFAILMICKSYPAIPEIYQIAAETRNFMGFHKLKLVN